ncbi:MAG TPA: cysteine--tRNA ligase [Elusimicrobiales bacterium]|nr:cysteine--tRNA ligase [Elusimicrobiales bacterium]
MVKLYSTLARTKLNFVPLKEGSVKIYACGITPYDEIHIGHARQAVVYDIIRNYFEYLKFEVTYVRNFTDVDDKIIRRANDEGRESSQISRHYIKENSEDLRRLKVRAATHEPKVTECMDAIIAMIGRLVDGGYAYVNNGEVFFAISKFKDYGKLSNRKKEELINAEDSPNKKDNADFCLWKPHKEGEPYWESPWGRGRPGWHIECSAMAHKFLGDTIDIHGGGIDLIFPHHENEIAQSEAHSGKAFAKYWLHNGLVMLNGSKMSKSTGNFMTIKDALKIYFPEELRYAILVQNYGSNIDFSRELFTNARKRLYYFYSTLAKINAFTGPRGPGAPDAAPPKVRDLEKNFSEFMDDNFNTPKVISELADVFKELNKLAGSKNHTAEEKAAVFGLFRRGFRNITQVLRLFEEDPEEYISALKARFLAEKNIDTALVAGRIEELRTAKAGKNYEKADSVKRELAGLGIKLLERSDSVDWEILFE